MPDVGLGSTATKLSSSTMSPLIPQQWHQSGHHSSSPVGHMPTSRRDRDGQNFQLNLPLAP
jgi:hypothetical protein